MLHRLITAAARQVRAFVAYVFSLLCGAAVFAACGGFVITVLPWLGKATGAYHY